MMLRKSKGFLSNFSCSHIRYSCTILMVERLGILLWASARRPTFQNTLLLTAKTHQGKGDQCLYH